ncbi:glycoside hydrolase superfamily [Dunaliella salina]|uniref:Chitinase domain-containing protein 1 n=1 Tax=Dunaliella salina TaxID=3046 RepID=A0ABQ7FWS0_DUNSA|nr:glycoside hydrolase superfamily [Dunaliella salina]|eukprot:KAF5826821.1 glycoside hydrolase superfamily [Dunaliella salina]
MQFLLTQTLSLSHPSSHHYILLSFLRKRELLPEHGPTPETVEESGLLEPTVTAATLYEKSRQWHDEATKIKRTGPTPVLGYVTPWNPAGYELSVRFRKKLTHVSPVWYQLRRAKVDSNKEWVLVGGHEYNQAWIDAVRQPGDAQESCAAVEEASCSMINAEVPTRIVPRVVVEVEEAQDHLDLVQSPEAAIEAIVREVEAKGYDGIVLEVWMTWAFMNGISNDAFRAAAFAFIQKLSSSLRALDPLGTERRQLILAVPPVVPSAPSRPRTDPAHMDRLAAFVDAWSVMTYDYSVGSGPQPNAPLPWLESNIALLHREATKSRPDQALMGLNFYGYDYAQRVPAAITADAYLGILSKHQPTLDWREEHGEHSFQYSVGIKLHTVYYPSPLSIQQRLKMFDEKGVGVSIWELGQGLDRWFELL